MVEATRLAGSNVLAYMGVNPYTPVPLIIEDSAPTSNDSANFLLGTVWLVAGDVMQIEVWVLTGLVGRVATWTQLYPQSANLTTFVCNTGSATPSSNILNVLGTDGASTEGSGNTVTIIVGPPGSSLTFDADTGSAMPSAGAITFAGGTNMNTEGASNIITVNLDNSVTLAGSLSVGGNLMVTGDATFVSTVTFIKSVTINTSITVDDNLTVGGTATFDGTATFNDGLKISGFGQGVVQSNSTGQLFCNKGTNGQVLIGSTPGAPAWNTITSMNGTVVITNGPNSINLAKSGGSGGVPPYFFMAYLNTITLHLSTGITPYALGTFTNPVYPFNNGQLTVITNTSGVFYPGNGVSSPATFTAPKTGYYKFTLSMGITGTNAASRQFGFCYIKTPAGTYFGSGGFPENGSFGNSYQNETICVASYVVPMTAGDVATFWGLTGTGSTPRDNTYTILGNQYWQFRDPRFPFGYVTYVQGYQIS